MNYRARLDATSEAVEAAALARINELEERNADLVRALKAIKSSLMHQRRFGADTMGAWRSAGTNAEGTAEDALLPNTTNEPPAGSASIKELG